MTSKTTKLAMAIAEHLDQLPYEIDRLSTRKLKEGMGYDGPGRTFTDAVRQIPHFTAWMLEGRSAIRLFPA